MKVIIAKDFSHLGKLGEVKEVKDGYARNYLIPRGIVLLDNEVNRKKIEDIKRRKILLQEKEKQNMIALKEKLEKLSLTIPCEIKKGEEIYGTITKQQISALLKKEGIDIEKDKIILDEPIDKLGVYNIKAVLAPEIVAILRIWIVKK